MHIKYAVVSLDHNVSLLRFEDPKNKIREGKKLPEEFQRQLYGPDEWVTEYLLSDITVNLLEGVALVGGRQVADDFVGEIFEAGREIATRISKTPTG